MQTLESPLFKASLLEAQLACIWRDVVRVDNINPDDDLFDLGAHSLLVAQIISRVRQELGAELSMRQVFDHSRFDRFAALVAQSIPVEPVPPVLPAKAA